MSFQPKFFYRFKFLAWTCFLWLLASCQLLAQNRLDQLEMALEQVKDPDSLLKVQMELFDYYTSSNPQKATTLFDELNGKITNSLPELYLPFLISKSRYFRMLSQFDKAEQEAYRALDGIGIHKDSLLLKAEIFNILGKIEDDSSNPKLAIDFHLKSLRYAEQANFEKGVIHACAGLGRAYLYLEDYPKAREFYERVIQLKLKRQEFDGNLGAYYLNLSIVSDGEGDYEESLESLNKAIDLLQQSRRYTKLISSYNNKAYTLFLMNRLAEAEESVKESIRLGDSLSWEPELMYSYSTYAEILFAQNRIPKAEEFIQKSITLSQKYKDLYLAKYNYNLLYNISLKKKDFEKALDYFRKRTEILDSLNSASSRREIEKLSLEYETEKKNREIQQLNKQQELSQTSLRKSKQLQWTFLIITLLALAVLFLLWSRQRAKRKAEALLKEAMKQEFNKKLADSELQALRAQMNPHFLFNCLNSINGFIVKNNKEKASEYLSKFSKLIRQVLNNSRAQKISLEQELETLQLYIDMEKLRFNNEFEYECTIASDVETDYVEVPPMIFQPYVENSIWHGLMHKKEGLGKLTLRIFMENPRKLVCEIEDNGIGRDAALQLRSKSASNRKSYGMSISQQRLYYSGLQQEEANEVQIIDMKDSKGIPTGTKVQIVWNL